MVKINFEKNEIINSEIFKLSSEKENILRVIDGRLVIIVYKENKKEYTKFLIGVDEEFIVKKNKVYYIKSLVDITHFSLKMDYLLLEEKNNKKIKNILLEIDDYYFGYEERYNKVYGMGADLWETEKPNESLLKIFNEHPNIFTGKVIDLGCGEGRDTIYLTRKNIDIKGVDISHSAIKKAKEKLVKYNIDEDIFYTGNVLYLNKFKNDTFHLAINMGCLHMINKEEDRKCHLKNVNRILKSKGYFVVDHCKSEWGKGFHTIDDYNKVRDKLKNFEKGHVIDRTISISGKKIKVPLEIIPYLEKSKEELINEITSYGFEVITTYDNYNESFGNSVIILFRKK